MWPPARLQRLQQRQGQPVLWREPGHGGGSRSSHRYSRRRCSRSSSCSCSSRSAAAAAAAAAAGAAAAAFGQPAWWHEPCRPLCPAPAMWAHRLTLGAAFIYSRGFSVFHSQPPLHPCDMDSPRFDACQPTLASSEQTLVPLCPAQAPGYGCALALPRGRLCAHPPVPFQRV